MPNYGFYEASDANIIYKKGFRGSITLGRIQTGSLGSWHVGIKDSNNDLIIFDKENVEFYSRISKKGVSRLTTAVLGATLGPIASAISMHNGLGFTCIVYVELVDNTSLVISCHEDFYKYIRRSCRKGTLDPHAEEMILKKIK